MVESIFSNSYLIDRLEVTTNNGKVQLELDIYWITKTAAARRLSVGKTPELCSIVSDELYNSDAAPIIWIATSSIVGAGISETVFYLLYVSATESSYCIKGILYTVYDFAILVSEYIFRFRRMHLCKALKLHRYKGCILIQYL